MKKVEVKNGCGYKVYNDNGVLIGFQGQNYGEGFIYKDYDAYEKTDDEVCYISEHAFDDYKDYIRVGADNGNGDFLFVEFDLGKARCVGNGFAKQFVAV